MERVHRCQTPHAVNGPKFLREVISLKIFKSLPCWVREFVVNDHLGNRS